MLKIGFFGTPELSASVLRGLLENENFSVEFAVTNPDKKFGRAQTLIASPVKILAESAQIPVFQPEKIRNNTEFLEKIAEYQCDYFVVVAYGKILPKELLEIPKKMCINVHGSILPKYRGASPIQSVLLNGEKETGVTIMQMSEGMDEGAMICVSKLSISPTETSTSLFEKFSEISPSALIDGILWLESGKYSPIEQNHSEATYCSKISKEDGKIDWNQTAREIFQKYQAYSPWPGIFDEYHGKRLLFEKISFSDEDVSQKSGTVFRIDDGKIAISTISGVIFPEIVKLEGKKSQSISDFINGNQAFLDFSFNQ